MMLGLSGSDIDTAMLEHLFETSKREGLGFSLEELERRMAIVSGAGISDPEKLRHHVLSQDGA